jgi:mannose-6-phosphate isomerase-like protein (cupin superfamily)
MEPQEQTGKGTAIHIPQGEGKSLWILDELLTFKVHDGQSQTVGIFEDEVLPQTGPPPHLHRTQDETHYVLEGQFEFVLEDRKVNADAGSVVYVPRTTVHAFTNIGTQKGKLLFIETPAGAVERWLEEAGEPVRDPSSPPEGPPDMDKLQASAQRTGAIEFVEPSEEGVGY